MCPEQRLVLIGGEADLTEKGSVRMAYCRRCVLPKCAALQRVIYAMRKVVASFRASNEVEKEDRKKKHKS